MANEPNGAGNDARHLIVSIDSHVDPQFDQLRQYCPKAYLEQWDTWCNTWLSFWGEERNWYGEASPIAARWQKPFTDEVRARTIELVDRAGAGIWDADARVRDMDADGIAAELVYHTAFTQAAFPFMAGVIPDPNRELETVGVQMYNRWVADFVAAAPNRLIGAAYLPIWDIEKSVETVRWAKEAGLHCFNFPAPHRSFPEYNLDIYEPFWAAVAESGLPLTTHGGAGDMPDYVGKEAWAIYCSDLFYYSRRGFTYLVWAGVFERYPEIQLAFTEQRSSWIPEQLAELDSVYHSNYQDLSELIPRPPSEYFNENCWLGVSFMSRFEAEQAPSLGIDRFMWGSDYPHFEGTWGYTEESLRQSFAGLDRKNVRKILGENAIKLFGLDATALRGIADRIGVKESAVDTPLEQAPEIPGLSFRTVGSWA